MYIGKTLTPEIQAKSLVQVTGQYVDVKILLENKLLLYQNIWSTWVIPVCVKVYLGIFKTVNIV